LFDTDEELVNFRKISFALQKGSRENIRIPLGAIVLALSGNSFS
jgi:hypothetical protein